MTNNLEIQLKSMENKFNMLTKANGNITGKYKEIKELNIQNLNLNNELN